MVNPNDVNPKKNNNKYVERAADILSKLVKEKRNHLPSSEEEAQKFKRQLQNLESLSSVFKENSKKLIEMIQRDRLKKK